MPKPEAAARSWGSAKMTCSREFAPLRHMEMLRACKKDEGIFLILF